MNDVLYFGMTLIGASWPVWLVGGIACVAWWRITKAWHPFLRVVARSFLLAIVLTPTLLEGHPPGLVPAISLFYLEGTDDWFMRGILPLLFGWLAGLIVLLVIEDVKGVSRA
jgi:hypothetical protein